MSESYATKTVKVLEEDSKRFEELYPQHGAWTWFVQTALRKFLDLHDEVPDEVIDLALIETRKVFDEEAQSGESVHP